MDNLTLEEVIERYALDEHPEGGYYRETWKSKRIIHNTALPDYPGSRSAGTSILYLLPEGEISSWHRFPSEELWLYHAGNPIELACAETLDSEPDVTRVGPGPRSQLQALVGSGLWQRTEALSGPSEWSLFACVVVPGFEFEDFEMAESAQN